MARKKKPSLISRVTFKILRFFFKLFYKRTNIEGIENIPKSNTVIVANHAQLNGPIIAELYMPENYYIWANGQMVRCRDVPAYAMEDFFPYKSKWTRPVYKLVSYILALLLPCVINNARAILVYRDARIVSTFKTTMRRLTEGNNIVIFPECHKRCNNIVNEFQENFIDIARLYYKRTGIELTFVPMYIAPKMGKAYVGTPTRFDSSCDITEERSRIAEYLSEEITRLGRSLPEHVVVPFDNISEKDYISNKSFDLIPGEN